MDGNGDRDMAEQMEKLKERTKAFAAQLKAEKAELEALACLLYTSPSPRDKRQSRMPSSA